MTVPKQEAADTLRAIESAASHSAAAYRNRIASPYLVLWGVIWMIGYSIEYFGYSPWIWAVLVTAGGVASFALGRRLPRSGGANDGWRSGATIIDVFLFISGLFTIMAPRAQIQVDAFFPLLVALWYALMGIRGKGTRMVWLGVALGALTFIGYFALPNSFALWMAGMGGGALVLGGFWLRMA